jgi:hypothetical protein
MLENADVDVTAIIQPITYTLYNSLPVHSQALLSSRLWLVPIWTLTAGTNNIFRIYSRYPYNKVMNKQKQLVAVTREDRAFQIFQAGAVAEDL